MPSSWSDAWATSWANAWGQTTGQCAWGGTWGTSWANAWCGGTTPEPEPEPTIVLAGGDDAPLRRRRRRRTQQDLFRELEDTVHALLHPVEIESRSSPQVARVDHDSTTRAIEELLALAEQQHGFLQRVAALRTELNEMAAQRERMLADDEDEALLWMF